MTDDASSRPAGSLSDREGNSAGSLSDREGNSPGSLSDREGNSAGSLSDREGNSAGSLSDREVVVDVSRRLEAILLVVDEPQSLVSLAAAVGAPVPAVRQAIEGLVDDYDGTAGTPRRGFELREVGGGWRLYVRAEHDDLVTEFVNTQAPSRLSQAALETLAVIAYKQPVTRGQVASIRAVNVDSVVRTLVARGLITEAFTDPDTGAIHYATTDALLVNLGINSIDELPHISPLLDDGAEGFDTEIVR